MSKKVLFIVGSLRQGSFNHQMALEAEKALAGKLRLAISISQLFPSLAKIWKFQLLQLLLLLVKQFLLQTLSGASLQSTTSLSLEQ